MAMPGGEISARRSWRAPLVGAFLAIAIAFAMCAGLVVWGHRTFPNADENAVRRFRQYLPVLQGGGATFYAFQRVPMNLELRESTTERVNSRFEDPERADVRVVVSPLGGLLVVGVALVAGGAVAWRKRDAEDDSIAGAAGRMAIVFALASLVLSFVLPLAKTTLEPQAFARRSTFLAYEPSHLGAFVWPWVWAFLFGSLGMHIARHGRGWRRRLVEQLAARSPDGANALRAAASGLATGALLVLLAGVLTAGVAIARNPTKAGDVLGSGRDVAGIVEGVALGLPHATGAGLLGSMGVPAKYGTTVYNRDDPTEGSVGIFGGRSRQPEGSATIPVPRYALGGLAIGAILTMVTGFRAAAGASGESSRLRSVLMAAGISTVFLWVIAYLIGGSARMLMGIEELRESGASIGASPLAALFVPVVWTFGGGLVGAFLQRQGSRAVETTRRAYARPAVIGAAVVLITVGAGVFASTRILDPTPEIEAGRPGWNVYRDPTNGWTLEFPESWNAQHVSDVESGGPHRLGVHGVVLSNIDKHFERHLTQNSWTPYVDLRGAPTSIVAVQVSFSYGGLSFPCPSSPLPLSLDRADRSLTKDGAGGTQQTRLSLRFAAQNSPGYFVVAWIGSNAPQADVALLRQIVASISFEDAPPGEAVDVNRKCEF